MDKEQERAVQTATNKQLLRMLVKQVDSVQATQQEDGRTLASLVTEMIGVKEAVEVCYDNAGKIKVLQERVAWHQYIIGGTFLASLIAVFRQQIELLLDRITQNISI